MGVTQAQGIQMTCHRVEVVVVYDGLVQWFQRNHNSAFPFNESVKT